jgi:adenosylcobinamide-phosphate synthase
MSAALALVAMVIELCLGYPEPLVRAIGHPVTWIGALIATLDRTLNRSPYPPPQAQDGRLGVRLAGIIAVLIVLGIVGSIAFVVEQALLRIPFGFFAAAVLASALIAQRSLHRHVADVAAALEMNGIEAGRVAVSHIVGRDTAALDEAGVARAAIESLAENFSDAVVAPALWLAVAGLPGAALYKAINTADSMIGHRTPRYEAFGWAAARLDDVINLPASRLTALLLATAAALRRDTSATSAWRTVRRDAARHRSPNAGYPEAAMAGALGLSLAGPRSYGGLRVDDAAMGDGRRDATAADIRRALSLYRTADAILIAFIGVLAAIFSAPM